MQNEMPKRKIGIFSMIPGPNFGNRLQNFAVQQFLEEQGAEAVTMRYDRSIFIGSRTQRVDVKAKINHAWDSLHRHLTKLPGCRHDGDSKKIKDRKNWTIQYQAMEKERRAAYESFDQEHMHFSDFSITRDCQEFKQLQGFDCFVCGSDQIWNPYYDLQDIYFLSVVPEYKRIALAPSIGVEKLEKADREEMAELINHIPYLSVREQSGAELIDEMTGREAAVLQDPTVWISAQTWRNFAKEPASIPEKPYVLCYFLGNRTTAYTKRIQEIASRNHLDIINLLDVHQPEHYANDPANFVWLIDHASLICTDSFHGVAFSIILQRPFLAFDRVMRFPSMSSRITGLMQHVGLDRHVDRVPEQDYLNLDYSDVQQILEHTRANAISFFQNAVLDIDQHDQRKLPELAVHSHCNGCRACEQACPVGAIDWKKDSEGFFRPHVNADSCIGCKKCQSVCHVVNHTHEEEQQYPEAVAAYAKDDAIRMESSSGGCFTVLAKVILARGGVVFGAAFDAEWHVRHRYIEREEDLALLRTSKYVQSDVGDCYKQAKSFLEQGRWVYFSGTPCQVQGLRSYLGKDYDKLILQDIICHGVPSEDVWDAYLTQQYGDKSEIRSINFRAKTEGWNNYRIAVETSSRLYSKERRKDPYFVAFTYGGSVSLRPACYQCVNKCAKRNADLTLADYWGISAVHPEIDAYNGVSLVLLQSEKGKELLEHCKDQLFVRETNCEKALQRNENMTASARNYPRDRMEFFENYSDGIEKTVKNLLKKPFAYPLMIWARNCARNIMKKVKL